MHIETTTDWITAIATVFAAIGTVGAVIVALWQTVGQDRVEVKVRCSYRPSTEQTDGGGILILVANNSRRAPVNIVAAGINAAGRTFSPSRENDKLFPVKLGHKDFVATSWTATELRTFEREAGPLSSAVFMSELDGGFRAHLPGGGVRRLWWRPRRGLRHNADFPYTPPPEPPWLLKTAG